MKGSRGYVFTSPISPPPPPSVTSNITPIYRWLILHCPVFLFVLYFPSNKKEKKNICVARLLFCPLIVFPSL